MTNVIDMFPDESGYITTDKSIEGVYNKDLAAWKDGDLVSVGKKEKDGIADPVFIEVEDMNRFCIMWLAIFSPESLNYD